MRPRKRNKDLPRRVYRRGPSYYYVHPSGKWEKIGRTMREVYGYLHRLHSTGSMASIMDRYGDEILPGKAESTQSVQRAQLATLRQVFGHMEPHEVMPSDAAEFLDSYPSPVNANRHMALLSHVFTKAIRWQLANDNPCRKVERNKEKPRSRYVTNAEFWEVHQAMPQHIQILMELALSTGQRQGDLLAMEWASVRQDGIYFEQAKTGKRLIILHTVLQVRAIRKAWARGQGQYVLTNSRGHKLSPSAVHSVWGRYMRQHEPRFTFHDIRAKSASDHATGEHLGHNSQQMLQRVYKRVPKAVRGV